MVRKTSAGIILCTKTDRGYEFLAIKKRYTYAFFDFAHGHYESIDDFTRSGKKKYSIVELLQKMTHEELKLILLFNFELLWQRIYHGKLRPFYRKNYNLFMYNFQFNVNNQNKLISIISELTQNNSVLWEFPKGRIDSGETHIQAAVREFNEETGISKSSYTLVDKYEYVYEYTKKNISYRFVYYLAILNTEKPDFKIMAGSEHINEVDSFVWFSISDLEVLNKFSKHYMLDAAKSARNFLRKRKFMDKIAVLENPFY